jgi:hypothetical protein
MGVTKPGQHVGASMSTEQWPLRQDPEAPVIFAQSLLEDAEALAFVVLDDDDDWFISDGSEFSDDMEVNRAQFVSLPLHDALERIPDLVALAALPTGMAADWDPDRRTWLLSSVADPEAEEFEVEVLELEHVVRLYPDVVGVLTAAPGQVYDRAAPGDDWELVEG